MSAYSTIRITRSHALLFYLQKIAGHVTDRQLEDACDEALEPGLRNCIIVDDDSPENDNIELHIP